MNETIKTISESLVQLINAGGPYAIWAAIVVYVVPKLVTGGVILCLVRMISRASLEAWRINRDSRVKSISLLSSEVSAEVSSSMDHLINSVGTVSKVAEECLSKVESGLASVEAYLRSSKETDSREPETSSSEPSQDPGIRQAGGE